MNMLELPVGSVFPYTNEEESPRVLRNCRVVEVLKDPKAFGMPCAGCLFEEGSVDTCFHIACTPLERTDAKNVKFVAVKGGEE